MAKKIIRAVVIIIILAGAAAGGYYGWTQLQEEAPLSELYATQPVQRTDVAQTVLATGNVHAREIVPLYMTRTQTVETVRVKKGDPVTEGQVLITYDIEQDRAELERQLEQAQINLDNAELGLDLIGQPATGNELLQYESDVTAAEKDIFDAENELAGTQNRIAQQQRKIDDAQKTLDRNTELLAAGAAAQAEYDNAETAYKSAAEAMDDLQLQLSANERALEQRRTQLDEATLRLENALNKASEETNAVKSDQQENTIRLRELDLAQIEDDLEKLVAETLSPYTGYISDVYVQDGGTAAKGGLLAEVADLSQTIIQADITEYDAPLLSAGLSASFTTSGLPDSVYTGEITKISAGAVEEENSSGTEQVVPVEITVTNADDRLKPGYTVDIEFFIDRRAQVLAAPVQAVAAEDGKQYVYVLLNDTITRKEITTGLRGDKLVEIVSGLEEGELVVVNHAEIQEEHKS